MTTPQPFDSAPAQPSPAECRAALERILASSVFEQAGRASEFLRFVVEETLAGRGDRLKGYAIAVEVFPNYGVYQKNTKRTIPVFLAEPV